MSRAASPTSRPPATTPASSPSTSTCATSATAPSCAARSRCSGAAATRLRRRARSARSRTARWCRCDARRQAHPRHRRDDRRLDRVRVAAARPGARRRGRPDRLRPRPAPDRARRAPPAEHARRARARRQRPERPRRRARDAAKSAGAASTASCTRSRSRPPTRWAANFLATPPESAETAFRPAPTRSRRWPRPLPPLLPRGRRPSSAWTSTPRSPGRSTTGWASPRRRSRRSARYLARDLGPHGVRVNLVSAGPLRDGRRLRHPRLRRARRRAGSGRRRWAGTCATRPRSPTPCCFLLSDCARGITGEIVHVDGGLHAVGAPA